MLVLTRKVGQAIEVDGPAKICVLSVRGKTMRIGVQANREVNVLRGEIQGRATNDTRRNGRQGGSV